MSRLESSLNKKIDGLDHKIDMVEASLNRRIDSVESSLNKNIDDLRHNDLAAINRRIDDLKHNDFAHLNSTIEALTFTLEKNGFLKREDKEYVDRRLTV
jgi:DNA anti-recombination protein RmuC